MSAVAPDKPRAAVAPARRHSEGRDPVSFARYPQYKDSGVAWLGEVPAHWEIAPFKRAATNNDGGVWGSEPDGEDGTIVLRSTEQTVDGNWSIDDPAVRKLTERERTDALLRTGDLVITKSSGSALHIGKTTLVTAEIAQLGCCYSNFMQRVRTSRDLLPKLAWYVLNSDLARSQFDLLSNSTTGLANLNAAMIGRLVIVLPPVGEQEAIAAFLDRETAKIDALIAEQEKLIALLKEKRQALISHAVTKGLHPNAPMKDSGIEWLGQVPAHWDVCQMRRILACKLTNGIFKRKEDFGDGTLLVNVFDAYRPDFKVGFATLDRARCDANEQKVYAIEDGDILFVRSSLKIEGVAVGVLVERPPEKTVFECHLIRARLRVERVLPRFTSFLLASTQYRDRLVSLAKVTTMTTIEQESLASLSMVLPPLSDQVEIAVKLDQEVSAFDMLAESAQHAVGLLKERRAALISAAVTGKIDVRGQAAEAGA